MKTKEHKIETRARLTTGHQPQLCSLPRHCPQFCTRQHCRRCSRSSSSVVAEILDLMSSKSSGEWILLCDIVINIDMCCGLKSRGEYEMEMAGAALNKDEPRHDSQI
jgi:hypothetical protein